MRSLFIVTSKMFGLFQVYSTLFYVATVIPLMNMLSSAYASDAEVKTSAGTNIILTTGSIAAAILLALGVAWVLIFRAPWLADKLHIPEHDGEPPFSGSAILGAGTRLIAIFIVIQAAPDLCRAVAETMTQTQWAMSARTTMSEGLFQRSVLNGVWTELLPAMLKLFLGLFLAFRTQTVINWIDGNKGTAEPRSRPVR
jgi:hypothetical protein